MYYQTRQSPQATSASLQGDTINAMTENTSEFEDLNVINTLIKDERSQSSLIALLHGQDPVVSRLAANCLGSMGDMEVVRPLARMLHSEDLELVMACEHALWSVWFRQAGRAAAETLHKAADLAAKGKAAESTTLFDQLIAQHPTFAEVYHQRGMVLYLSDAYYDAITDFLRTIQLNDVHFSAMANLGHCAVQLGRYEAAQKWYLAALDIHPKLPGVRQVLRRLRDFVSPTGHLTA